MHTLIKGLKVFLKLLIFSIILTSCKKEESTTEIEKSWQQFLTVIEENNIDEFRKLASDTIDCYLCLENTEHEQKVLEYLRNNDSAFYNKIYTEKIYLPINKFIEEDFNLIFDEKFVSLLKESKTIFSKREFDEDGTETNSDNYEILVTTSKPNFLGEEGGQHVFQFKNINGNYKLTRIMTIP